MPANLSGPGAAICRHNASWSLARMLTQKRPTFSIRGQLPDDLAGKKATSGGSSETEVKEPTTIPTAVPSGSTAVTTHTPVG